MDPSIPFLPTPSPGPPGAVKRKVVYQDCIISPTTSPIAPVRTITNTTTGALRRVGHLDDTFPVAGGGSGGVSASTSSFQRVCAPLYLSKIVIVMEKRFVSVCERV